MAIGTAITTGSRRMIAGLPRSPSLAILESPAGVPTVEQPLSRSILQVATMPSAGFAMAVGTTSANNNTSDSTETRAHTRLDERERLQRPERFHGRGQLHKREQFYERAQL
jgi:hypothetical protein